MLERIRERFQGVLGGTSDQPLPYKGKAAQAKKLGLALSGGGYRAAAFHLGVLDALHEENVLDNVRVLSTVSGGSIVGALYCHSKETYEAFHATARGILGGRTLLSARDILLTTVLRLPLMPLAPFNQAYSYSGVASSQTNTLISRYNRFIFKGAKLNQLSSQKPYLMVNYANLRTGNLWVFTGQDMGDINLGTEREWRKTARAAGDYEIAKAVAASSAFPGVLGPVKLGPRGVEVRLSDGGIVDNLGVTGLLAEECDFLIVSDASSPLNKDQRPSTDPLGVIMRAINLSGNQLREARLALVSELGGAVIGVSSSRPGQQEKLADILASIPTELKALNEDDLNHLIGHGHDLTQYVLAQ